MFVDLGGVEERLSHEDYLLGTLALLLEATMIQIEITANIEINDHQLQLGANLFFVEVRVLQMANDVHIIASSYTIGDCMLTGR